MSYIRDATRIGTHLIAINILCVAIAGCSGTGGGGGAPPPKGNTGPDASATGAGTTTTTSAQSAAGSSAGGHGGGGSGFKLPPVHLSAPHVDVNLHH